MSYCCDVCGKEYKNMSSVKRHIREQHSDNLNVVCELCGKRYATLGGLQRHLTSTHKMDVDKRLDYYDTYIKKDDEGYCKQCGKRLKLVKDRFSEGYMKFCHNTDCNVLWHNKHNNRLVKSSDGIKKAIEKNPSYLNSKIEYWINKGYTEEDAKIQLSKRQTTFSKEICIDKYGDEEGVNVFNKRQEKWLDTLDSKSDEEKQRINRLKAKSAGALSKAEKELCEILGGINQYTIDGAGYVYDIYIEGKLIEYNGDYWHCNPDKYSPDYYNKQLHMTASEKWLYDEKKIQHAKDNGYDILVVWEKDYTENKQAVIERCLDFIRGD